MPLRIHIAKLAHHGSPIPQSNGRVTRASDRKPLPKEGPNNVGPSTAALAKSLCTLIIALYTAYLLVLVPTLENILGG